MTSLDKNILNAILQFINEYKDKKDMIIYSKYLLKRFIQKIKDIYYICVEIYYNKKNYNIIFYTWSDSRLIVKLTLCDDNLFRFEFKNKLYNINEDNLLVNNITNLLLL